MNLEQKYVKLSDVQHVLKRPGRYLGSVVDHTAIAWAILNGKMVKQELTWNPALLKMFDEIVSNSVDESKRQNSSLDTIRITISNDGTISVLDNGGIPVSVHKEHQQWIPEMIFSELKAGSNFDDDVESSLTGQNGEGASLTNIFSERFVVETCDGKMFFVQTWSNNMSETSGPKVKKTKKKGFTRITWRPDYAKFNRTGLTVGDRAKINKRVYDIAACNPNLKIYLNDERIKIPSFKKYISMYCEEFVYDSNEDWQIGIAASDDGFQQVSFVNSTETITGGTHIDYIAWQIIDKIRAFILKKYKIDVKPAAIRSHMMLFINARIINPRYDSQTKEKLITEQRDYGTSFVVSDRTIDKLLKGNVVQSVLDWVKAKERQAEIAKIRKAQKDNKNRKVSTHIRANSKNREKCILHLMEGESAINSFISVRDDKYHGAYPLTGKPLNWRNKDELSKVASNAIISDIMSIIGLEFGKPAKNLNYGKIRICTDADLDGAGSIVGLLLNFFSMWKELFDEKRIEILKSPIIIVRKGKESKRFYSLDEWQKKSEKYSGWDVIYAKGLGSLEEDDYDQMINSPVSEIVVMDEKGEESLQMAFGDDIQARKVWLS